MIVNFKTCKINRDTHKLIWIAMLIKKTFLKKVCYFIFSTQIESLIYNICDKFLTSMQINYTFFNI
jgi:hypothetical protein